VEFHRDTSAKSIEMAWTSLCATSEVAEKTGKYVEIGGFHLAVFRQGDTFYAMDNTCPHAGGSLAAGHVHDGCAICPWHNWAFRLDNGQLRDLPRIAVTTYATKVLVRLGEPDLVQADLPMY